MRIVLTCALTCALPIAGSHGAWLQRAAGPRAPLGYRRWVVIPVRVRSGCHRRAGQGHWHGCDWLDPAGDKIPNSAKKSSGGMLACNWHRGPSLAPVRRPQPGHPPPASAPGAGTGRSWRIPPAHHRGPVRARRLPHPDNECGARSLAGCGKRARVLPCLSVGRGIDRKFFFL